MTNLFFFATNAQMYLANMKKIRAFVAYKLKQNILTVNNFDYSQKSINPKFNVQNL